MTIPAHVVERLRAANGTRRPTSEPLVGDLAVLDGTVGGQHAVGPTVGRVRSRWAHRGTLWLSVEVGGRLLVAPVARARRAAEPLPPVGGTFLATTASQAEGAPPRRFRVAWCDVRHRVVLVDEDGVTYGLQSVRAGLIRVVPGLVPAPRTAVEP